MLAQRQASAPPILLQWSVHLARATPARTISAFAAVMLGSATVGALWRSPGLGAVAFVLLLLATSEYFFPIRYLITEQAIHCRNLLTCRRLEWKSVRSCFHDADGIKLSPLARPSRLEAFRGIYLRFPEQGAEALREQVEAIILDKCAALKEAGA